MVMRLFLSGKSTAAGGSLHILEQEVSYSFERQSLTLRLWNEHGYCEQKDYKHEPVPFGKCRFIVTVYFNDL